MCWNDGRTVGIYPRCQPLSGLLIRSPVDCNNRLHIGTHKQGLTGLMIIRGIMSTWEGDREVAPPQQNLTVPVNAKDKVHLANSPGITLPISLLVRTRISTIEILIWIPLWSCFNVRGYNLGNEGLTRYSSKSWIHSLDWLISAAHAQGFYFWCTLAMAADHQKLHRLQPAFYKGAVSVTRRI